MIVVPDEVIRTVVPGSDTRLAVDDVVTAAAPLVDAVDYDVCIRTLLDTCTSGRVGRATHSEWIRHRNCTKTQRNLCKRNITLMLCNDVRIVHTNINVTHSCATVNRSLPDQHRSTQIRTEDDPICGY